MWIAGTSVVLSKVLVTGVVKSGRAVKRDIMTQAMGATAPLADETCMNVLRGYEVSLVYHELIIGKRYNIKYKHLNISL